MNKKMMKFVVSISALGLLLFIIISSTAPFKDKIFSLLFPKPSSFAAMDTQAGSLRLTATFNSIGIELPFLGDDNGNATATLEFKKTSDSTWRQGLPLWRTQGTAGLVAEGPNQGQIAGIVSEARAQTPLPVFPGAVGFGTNTPAGRGGTVIKVTNLDDSGTGSLRDCVSRSGPRVCVFEVSGVINLLSNLNINNPFITIAGQTAPPPGITLKGKSLKVSTNDVLVAHIRTRIGCCRDTGGAQDAVSVSGGAYNVVIDHVSAAWATDEGMSAHGEAVTGDTTRDVTFLNSIMAEGLVPHSKGGVAKYSNRVAYINNLFVHNDSRNPKFGDNNNSSHAEFLAINNLIYNWEGGEITIDADGTSFKKVNFVGNVFKSGANSRLDKAMIFSVGNGNQIYAADNRRNAVVQSSPSDWSIIQVTDSTTHVPLTSPSFPIPFTPKPSSEVSDFVLAQAGARPAERGSANEDPVDGRVVSNARTGGGTLISNENEVGGFPSIPVNTRSLVLPPDPSGDSDGDGYTNLEQWLHGYSALVEGTSGSTPTPGPSPTPGASPTDTPTPTSTPPAGLTGAFYGSALLLEQNTSYDIRITLNDPDGVSGSNEVRGNISTRADNIPAASSLTPTHFVRADGNDSNSGTSDSPAGAWKTLEKAVRSAPSGAVVEVGPGYFVSTASDRTTPITIKAKFPAVQYNPVTKQMDVINTGSQTIIEPRGSDGAPAVSAPGAATWVEATEFPVPAGDPYPNHKIYKWIGSPVGNAKQMGYAGTQAGVPMRIANWVSNRADIDTPSEWANKVYNMTGAGSYHFGFWAKDLDIYVRMPPQTGGNPNDYYLTIGAATQANGGFGLAITADDVRVSGLVFRNQSQAITLRGSADRAIIDHNYMTGNQDGILMQGSGEVYGAGHAIEYNRFEDSNLWSADQATNPSIPFNFIKRAGSYGSGNEASGINGVLHKEAVIRYNTGIGLFDMVSVSSDLSRRDFRSNIDIHDNFISQTINSAFRTPDQWINLRIWNNRTEKTLVFWIATRFAYGPAYNFRNTAWLMSQNGIALDGGGMGPPAASVIKYGDNDPPGPRGKIYLMHNTFWSSDDSAFITRQYNELALQPPCGTVCPVFDIRNNTVRLGGPIADLLGVNNGWWNENYNDWSTSNTSAGVGINFFDTIFDDFPGKRFFNYRTASGQGANSNSRTCPNPSSCTSSIKNPPAPTEFIDIATGDLRLSSSSWFIDKGAPVANISDICGFNYSGTAPDLGATERVSSASCPSGSPTPTPTPSASPPVGGRPLSITSGPEASSTNTSATITWVTNNPSSSQVIYDIDDSGRDEFRAPEVRTPEEDTTVTNHRVIMSNLSSCTRYRFRVFSRSGSLTVQSGRSSFDTRGCTGDSDIVSEASRRIRSVLGGNLDLLDTSGRGLRLIVPNLFHTDDSADFQIRRLEASRVLGSLPQPLGYQSAGNNVYRLDAFTDSSNTLQVFSRNMTLTVSYSDADVAGIDPNSLKIHRFNTTANSWEPLTNCTVNTTLKTVTCETTRF